MHQDHSSPASLSVLHPMHLKESHSSLAKNSLRLHGSYTMALKRASKEPEYSRSYTFGDPVAMIDWKAYGRTDQLIIREQKDEASVRVGVIFDNTDTMQWPREAEQTPFVPAKLEIALRIALHLSHLHLRMGDQVSLWMVHDPMEELPLFRYKPDSPSDILSLFNALASRRFSPELLTQYFKKDRFRISSFDRACWITDALCRSDYSQLARLSPHGGLIHILSSLETDMSWLDDQCCYFDKDTVKKEFLGIKLKKGRFFTEQLSQWISRTREELKKQRLNYFLATDKTGLSSYLRFLDVMYQSDKRGIKSGGGRKTR